VNVHGLALDVRVIGCDVLSASAEPGAAVAPYNLAPGMLCAKIESATCLNPRQQRGHLASSASPPTTEESARSCHTSNTATTPSESLRIDLLDLQPARPDVSPGHYQDGDEDGEEDVRGSLRWRAGQFVMSPERISDND
jgi:hypothetical protein